MCYLRLLVCLCLSMLLAHHLSAQLILNGGFEGSGFWATVGDMHYGVANTNPHSGVGYAYSASNAAGSPGNNLSGILHSPMITIPANVQSVELRFWLSISTSEPGNLPYDTLMVNAGNDSLVMYTNLDGVFGTSIAGVSCNSCIYVQRTISLDSYIGQSIALFFYVQTDAIYPTVFRIDDVEIITTPLVPTVCPDPSALLVSSITSSSAVLDWSGMLDPGWDGYDLRVYSSVNTVVASGNNLSAASFVATGLTPGETYSWKVKTDCGSGSANQSSWIWGPSFTTTAIAPSCTAPTQLAVTTVDCTTQTAIWTAVAGASSYELQYRQVGGVWLAATTTTATSYTNTNLYDDMDYQYRVRAICSSDTSPYLTGSVVSTGLCDCGEITTPTVIAGSSVVALSWPAVPGATSYDLWWRPNIAGSSYEHVVTGSNAYTITSYENTSLSAGAQYKILLRANCGGQTGDPYLLHVSTLSPSGCQPAVRPTIISRRDWLADKVCYSCHSTGGTLYSQSYADDYNWQAVRHDPKYIVLHHTAGGFSTVQGGGYLTGRSDQYWADHVLGSIHCGHTGDHGPSLHCRGWPDGAYHYIIDPNGNIYEGNREYAGQPQFQRSWHASGANSEAIGIAMIGHYGGNGRDPEQISPAAKTALVQLLAYLSQLYQIDLLDHTANASTPGVPKSNLRGHRDVPANKPCPGDGMYDGVYPDLVDIASEAASMVCPGGSGGWFTMNIYGSYLDQARVLVQTDSVWQELACSDKSGRVYLPSQPAWPLQDRVVAVVASGYDTAWVQLDSSTTHVPLVQDKDYQGIAGVRLGADQMLRSSDSSLLIKPKARNLLVWQVSMTGQTYSGVAGDSLILPLVLGENQLQVTYYSLVDTLRVTYVFERVETSSSLTRLVTVSSRTMLYVDDEYWGQVYPGTQRIYLRASARRLTFRSPGFIDQKVTLDNAGPHITAAQLPASPPIYSVLQHHRHAYQGLAMASSSQTPVFVHTSLAHELAALDFDPVGPLYTFASQGSVSDTLSIRSSMIIDEPLDLDHSDVYLLTRNSAGSWVKNLRTNIWSYWGEGNKLDLHAAQIWPGNSAAHVQLARRQLPDVLLDTLWLTGGVARLSWSDIYTDPDSFADRAVEIIGGSWFLGTVMDQDSLWVVIDDDSDAAGELILRADHDGLSRYDTVVVLERATVGLVNSDKNVIFSDPYPNPVKTEILVDYRIQSGAVVEYSLYDMNGKQLAQKLARYSSDSTGTERLGVSGYAAGLYILQIKHHDQILTFKIRVGQ